MHTRAGVSHFWFLGHGSMYFPDDALGNGLGDGIGGLRQLMDGGGARGRGYRGRLGSSVVVGGRRGVVIIGLEKRKCQTSRSNIF